MARLTMLSSLPTTTLWAFLRNLSAEPEPEDDADGKPYALRQRKNISYAIPAPLEELARRIDKGEKAAVATALEETGPKRD